VNLHRVADAKVGDVLAEQGGVNGIKFLHCFFRFLHSLRDDCGEVLSRCVKPGCSPEAENP
jgi:hypothetical protein